MDHADHIRLLQGGVPRQVGTWADLGAGEGAFTLALAELLPGGSTIHAVDRDRSALRALADAYAGFARGRESPRLETVVADFTRELALPPLDGVVMANSLHFVKEKAPMLARVRSLLKPDAPLLLVEYDADRGNQWVPYPLSFATWRRFAVDCGFDEPRLLATVPSRFLGGIYSAATRGRTAPPPR